MAKLTRKRLRTMRDRWQRDLDALEAAFPGLDLGEHFGPEAEAIRNLATAIGEIDGIIANVTPLGRRYPARRALEQGGSGNG